MMATFLLVLVVMLVSIAGLALGVLFGGSPIKGSCGGLAGAAGVGCGACSKPPEQRCDQSAAIQ